MAILSERLLKKRPTLIVLLALWVCQLQRLIQCHTHLASENLVTMVEKFLDHTKKKLRQQRQRRQRERHKKQWVYSSKTTTLHVHHAFLHIFSHRCTAATWNFLISRARLRSRWTQLFLNSDTILSDSIQKICQHLTNKMKLNKIDKVWNSAKLLFKWIFGLLSNKSLLPWQRDVTTSPLSISTVVLKFFDLLLQLVALACIFEGRLQRKNYQWLKEENLKGHFFLLCPLLGALKQKGRKSFSLPTFPWKFRPRCLHQHLRWGSIKQAIPRAACLQGYPLWILWLS